MAIQFKSSTGFDYVSAATPLPVTIVGGGTGDVDGPSSATDNAIALFDGTTGKLLKNSSVTLSGTTLTAADTGDLGVSAGATNRNITLTPGGTGVVSATGALSCTGNASNRTWAGDGAYSPKLFFQDSAAFVVGNYSASGSPQVITRNFLAGGNMGSPTATPAFSTTGFSLHTHSGTSWAEPAVFFFQVRGTQTESSRPSGFYIYTTVTNAAGSAERLAVEETGLFKVTGGSKSVSAYGLNGTIFRVGSNGTITDTSSSGTVASAVLTLFQQSTLAASSATTYTDAATIYISSQPTAGTNVTITNPWAFWIDAGNARFDGAIVCPPQALSGAGAINLTTTATDFTSTGGAQALTLANGVAGQLKTITHVVDGGSGVLTPTTAVGYTTITFTNAGESVTLRYTSAGWAIIGIHGAVAA
jgi:hypothetical protein